MEVISRVSVYGRLPRTLQYQDSIIQEQASNPNITIKIISYIRLVEVDFVRELQSDLVECTSGPVTKPVENTSVKQGRGGGSTVLQTLRGGVHREHNMEVTHYLRGRREREMMMIVTRTTVTIIITNKSTPAGTGHSHEHGHTGTIEHVMIHYLQDRV